MELAKPLSTADQRTFTDVKHDTYWKDNGITFIKHDIVKNVKGGKKHKKKYRLYERVDTPSFYDISNMTYE